MWPRDAYVGQRVVCVDDVIRSEDVPHWINLVGDLDGLTFGTVYTIRRIGISDIYGTVDIYLEEIIRPIESDEPETGYFADRFRPLDESRLDVFREMLKRPGVWSHDENRKDVVREPAV